MTQKSWNLDDLRTFVAKYCRKDLSSSPANETEKQTPQTFPIVECMVGGNNEVFFHKQCLPVGSKPPLVHIHCKFNRSKRILASAGTEALHSEVVHTCRCTWPLSHLSGGEVEKYSSMSSICQIGEDEVLQI